MQSRDLSSRQWNITISWHFPIFFRVMAYYTVRSACVNERGIRLGMPFLFGLWRLVLLVALWLRICSIPPLMGVLGVIYSFRGDKGTQGKIRLQIEFQ